jgi:hypothetical protein
MLAISPITTIVNTTPSIYTTECMTLPCSQR